MNFNSHDKFNENKTVNEVINALFSWLNDKGLPMKQADGINEFFLGSNAQIWRCREKKSIGSYNKKGNKQARPGNDASRLCHCVYGTCEMNGETDGRTDR